MLNSHDITCSDDSSVTENLKNHKVWFNGIKTFTSIKIKYVQQITELLIKVSDKTYTRDKLLKPHK